MAQPDAPRDDQRHDERPDERPDPQDDTTFATKADSTSDNAADTKQLEQTVHSDTTGQVDTAHRAESTERIDTTDAIRAIGVEEQPTSRDLFGNPMDPAEGAHPGAAATVPGSEDSSWPPVLPSRPSGPHAPAIVLGLVCLAIAGIILAQELGDLTVDWGDIGPVGIVLTGAVLVLFGLVGLLTSRRNSKIS
jgi:hypothetical protein